jgi:hypothetical protein
MKILFLHFIRFITYPIYRLLRLIFYPVWRPLYFLFVDLGWLGWTISLFCFGLFVIFYSEATYVDLTTIAVVTDKEYVEKDCWSTEHDIWNGYSNQTVYDRTCDLEHYRITIMIHSCYINGPIVMRYNIDEVLYNEGEKIQIGDTLDYLAYITIHRHSGDTLEQSIRERHFWE